ncbi:hypothetical protein NliqN6_4317 [Naganishia liquefaciens]|uniref:Ammonium transporter n=1 Tax=Naganishia liquefaciens TaxID=104408 RepID=A0A8H3TW88_9TREE|nr:hypothetical protein NliqN6_4317 [Naganishia liquefaciens]
MVNITYGVVTSGTDINDATINPAGTDMIVAQDDGTLACSYFSNAHSATANKRLNSAFDAGDIAWILTCTALVWLMIPGLGYLYSGLVRRKNALSLLFLTIVALAITSFQWWFWGYSLVFSETGGSFWGNLRNFCFMGVLGRPIPEANNKLPEIVFATYELMFACLVPAIVLGAAAERSRVLPAMVFIFCWTTLVYDPLAHWIWSSNGWAFKWGVLDYAGGVPVEIASGIGGLAYSYFIGKRRGYGTERILYKPHNVGHVILGTILLAVGWLGFNGGSTFAANLRAAMAVFNTNLAGSIAGIVWMIMDFRLERKWSVVGFCTGMITGLVAITPAAGNVGTPAAALIGVVSGALSNLATRLKVSMRVDDPMDIFAVHALAGIVGTFMTGIFAQASVINNDGYTIAPGGWLDGNWVQLGKQVAWIAVGVAWTFVVTYAIMFVINLVPGLHFRASEEAEVVGMDEVEHDEYVADYAWVQRDLEGNAPERTATDPREFVSEKNPAVGATAEIRSVGQPTPGSHGLASALRAENGIRHQQLSLNGQDAEKEMMRGRGEGGVDAETVPAQELQRVESGRRERIRGDDFRRIEGRGRGEGGVSDRDHAV